MTWLLENPLPVVFAGIVVEAILGVMLLRTGRGMLLGVMAGVLLLVLAGVGLEWLVVTDTERIEATLKETAAALEANDLQRVQATCCESAVHTRSEAARALNWVRFTGVKITDLQVKINRLTSPPTAKAQFIARVSAVDRKGVFANGTQIIGFTLDLRQQGDRWLISGHELKNAPGGF